jgi:hypothetical protein
MIKVQLIKDWEVQRECVISAGSFVMVQPHAAEQLKNAGFVEADVEPENKTLKTK